MGKEMRFDSNPSSLHKQNHVFCVKFAVSFLLMGLVFRLFFSDSITLSSVIETTTPPLADRKTESPWADQQTEPLLASPPPIQTLSAFDFPADEAQASQNDQSFHFVQRDILGILGVWWEIMVEAVERKVDEVDL